MRVSKTLESHIRAEVESRAEGYLKSVKEPYEAMRKGLEAKIEKVYEFAAGEKQAYRSRVAEYAAKLGLCARRQSSLWEIGSNDFDESYYETEWGKDYADHTRKYVKNKEMRKLESKIEQAEAKVAATVRDIILKLELGTAGRKSVAELLDSVRFD